MTLSRTRDVLYGQAIAMGTRTSEEDESTIQRERNERMKGEAKRKERSRKREGRREGRGEREVDGSRERTDKSSRDQAA